MGKVTGGRCKTALLQGVMGNGICVQLKDLMMGRAVWNRAIGHQ